MTRLVATRGNWVEPGETLVQLADPILEARAAVAAAALHEARVRLAAAEVDDPLGAEIVREELAHARARLFRLRAKLAKMAVPSTARGRFYPLRGEDLPGRFVEKGDLIGYVLEPGTPTVRVVIRQADVQRVGAHTRGISVRFADRPMTAYPARVVRVVPEASRQLPSRALSTAGGGRIPLDPRDPDGTRALESVFQVDLAVDGMPATPVFGTRVYVRFDHDREPVAAQVYRAARRLFHSEFDL